MERKKIVSMFSIFLILFSLPFSAYAQTIIFDQGPLTGTNNGCWQNLQTAQNFADQFSFPTTTTVTGISTFTCLNFPGSSVHIKILSNSGGTPGGILYQEDQVPASWVADPNGGYRITCNFAQPFVASPNTIYWIGVAGNSVDIGQSSVSTPGDGSMAQFSGTSFASNNNTVGDMMFQLYSEEKQSVPVSTMTEWGMIVFVVLTGIGALCSLRRQRRSER